MSIPLINEIGMCVHMDYMSLLFHLEARTPPKKNLERWGGGRTKNQDDDPTGSRCKLTFWG